MSAFRGLSRVALSTSSLRVFSARSSHKIKPPSYLGCAASVRCLHALASDFLPTNLPDWTESQKSVREAISKICLDFPDEYWAKHDTEHKFPWELYNRLAENGWLGICLPEKYGGSDLGISEAAIMLQTLAESGGCMNAASSVHMNIFGLEPVAKFGSDGQKERFLPPLIQGKDRACFGVTEPNTGRTLVAGHKNKKR